MGLHWPSAQMISTNFQENGMFKIMRLVGTTINASGNVRVGHHVLAGYQESVYLSTILTKSAVTQTLGGKSDVILLYYRTNGMSRAISQQMATIAE